MAKYRVRFNDKARAGGVAKRNQLKSKRQQQFHRGAAAGDGLTGGNASPSGQSADPAEAGGSADEAAVRDAEEAALRRQRAHEAARPESEARKRVRMAMQFPERANAAKRKRLDKYIEKQVRKEEKDVLLAKLARTQQHVNKDGLRSLGELGRGGFANLGSESEGDSDGQGESDHNEDVGNQSDSGSDDGESGSESDVANKPSTFIDRRNTGFGFTGLKTQPKKAKKASWRQRLGVAESESESESSESESETSESEDEVKGLQASDESDEEEGSDDESSKEESGEEVSEEESGEESGEESSNSAPVSEGTSFMNWAAAQTETEPSLPTPRPANYVHVARPTEGETDAAAEDAVSTAANWFPRLEIEPVVVDRSPYAMQQRLQLPAVGAETAVMDAVHHHDVVVITGATGSGKTTQIPQFLFESGYARRGRIAVTQPRRVAAVAMAQRIGRELGAAATVGYQIRFDAHVAPDTHIALMTDGVLLRELGSDLLLTRYSCVVVDEAHERSVNTDILIGLLSRVVALRRTKGNPLKLVIMSATLRVADFAENQRLFALPPPVVGVEARQFAVTTHFSRRTAADYVAEALRKTRRIHDQLPPGGILVFLTGKDEIQRFMREVDENYEVRDVRTAMTTVEEENVEFGVAGDDAEVDDGSEGDGSDSESDLDFDAEAEAQWDDVYAKASRGQPTESDGKPAKSGNSKTSNGNGAGATSPGGMHVLPLYSLLSTEDQMRVFAPVPEGKRLVVVATNVAETSLTIPGIRYVVDCGRAKQRMLANGVQTFAVRWVSQASADQRAGRAGRTGPGHCYRLYSSAVFERDFPQFGEPELLRMPVEGLVLQMKAMGIDGVLNFPFPTPMPPAALASGTSLLQNLGALDTSGHITELGVQMSALPLHPRHAKMLLIGNQGGALAYVVALVAAMSVQNVFAEREDAEGELPVLDETADVLQLVAATAAYSWHAGAASSSTFGRTGSATGEGDAAAIALCRQLGLRPKAMAEVASLRAQLARLVANTLKPSAAATLAAELSRPLDVPTPTQVAVLKQIVAAGYIDQVAARQAAVEAVTGAAARGVSRQPYVTAQPGPLVYIHPHSLLRRAPDFLVYHALTTHEDSEKVRLRPLTAISAAHLSALAKGSPLITHSKPLGGAYAPKAIDASTREAWVVPRYGVSGGRSWDLPPKKVKQVRKGGRWLDA